MEVNGTGVVGVGAGGGGERYGSGWATVCMRVAVLRARQ